ncbi:MAG: circadian clock KaiB family protein [Bacteroidales bacterium]
MSKSQKKVCRLILFIASDEPNSVITQKTITDFCEKNFKDSFELEIVDVFKDSALALENNIIAVPTLLVKEPLPERRIVGMIDSEEKFAAILGI